MDRLVLIKEKQIPQVKGFSTFLCYGEMQESFITSCDVDLSYMRLVSRAFCS